MRIKLAVLEDDNELRERILVPELAALGFDVEGFATAAQMYRRMVGKTFELLVLDIGLSEEDGFEVACHLRAISSIGIVALTGRGGRIDQLRGLNEGVDAWLVKPVDIDVLAATLNSLARRLHFDGDNNDSESNATQGWFIPEGSWHLNSPGGQSVLLNLQERRVLTRLLSMPGQPATREQLIGDLVDLGRDFDPHRLEMLVHRLRRKVAECIGESLPLRAVRGCGYVMLPPEARARRV
jgi:DNA-binding response OmpR family regulator